MGRVYELHRPADQAVAAQLPKRMPSMGDAVFFALAIGMRAWVESWMWLLPGVEITPTSAPCVPIRPFPRRSEPRWATRKRVAGTVYIERSPHKSKQR
jgi:hypothetical protein